MEIAKQASLVMLPVESSEHVPRQLDDEVVAEEFVVGLESAACYCWFQSAEDAKQVRSEESLAYELEDVIPIDGDDLALGWIRSGQGRLVVATDGTTISGRLNDILQGGRYVAAVSPVVLLALSEFLRSKESTQYDAVLWYTASGVDAIKLEDSKVVDWQWIAATIVAIESLIVKWQPQEERQAWLAINMPAGMVTPLAELVGSEERAMDRELLAREESDRIVAGDVPPIVDLRSGPLKTAEPFRSIRRPLVTLVVGLAVVQVFIIAALFFRAHRFQTEASSFVAEQESEFGRVFPKQAIPVGIVSRLESEHRRLAGTRGVSDQGIPKLESAIPLAHVLLSTLPEPQDARFVIDRIVILPSEIATLSGTAKSYADLEVITNRMKQGGLVLPPVSSSTTSAGVSMRFDGATLRQSGAAN